MRGEREGGLVWLRNINLTKSLGDTHSTYLELLKEQQEMQKEKGVIIEEINMSEDNPEDVLEDIHSKVIFGDNSLADPILGTIDIIKSLNILI